MVSAPNVVNVNNVYKIPFKADDRPQSYPQAVRQNRADSFQKEREKQQRKQKWLTGLSIASTLAIIAMAVVSIRQARGGGADVEKALTEVNINWQDMKDAKNKVASLDSKTTNKKLREEFQRLMKNSKLSDKAKEWCGYADSTELIYLYGYGGTGKTYVARQYAQEIGALYAQIKYPDLGSMWKDAASKRVNSMFKEVANFANKNPDRQIVLCIDEVDALIRKVTENASGTEEASKVRSAVLTGIDELTSSCKNVKVIMTSNYHPESGVIDDVIKSRLNKKIEVKLPDLEQTKALFEMYLGKIKAIKPEFYNSTEFKNFADRIVKEGYSSREIEKISHEVTNIFGGELTGVADSELETHKFLMKYLEKAKENIGEAASKTNETMRH